MFVCVLYVVTLFFQFFLCHEQLFIFNKQKSTDEPISKFLFMTIYLGGDVTEKGGGDPSPWEVILKA